MKEFICDIPLIIKIKYPKFISIIPKFIFTIKKKKITKINYCLRLSLDNMKNYVSSVQHIIWTSSEYILVIYENMESKYDLVELKLVNLNDEQLSLEIAYLNILIYVLFYLFFLI